MPEPDEDEETVESEPTADAEDDAAGEVSSDDSEHAEQEPEEPDEQHEPTEPEEPEEPEPEAENAVDAEEPAAEPAAAVGSEPGALRRRLAALLARPTRTQVTVAVLLGVLGFAAVTQVRINDPEGDYSALRQQELIDVLDGLAGARQRAESEIDELERARDELRDDSSQRQAALDRAQGDVDNLNILAGLVPVTGPGIRVTVVEETGTVQLDSMLDVIQELRTADAEAIEINGTVRVVADTSVEQTSGGFVMDGQLVEPPYLIAAIGEPAALAGAMDTRVGAGAGLREDGADVRVEELNSLDITAVNEPDDPQYAVPDGDQ